jgi:hypothetical protein
MGSNPSRPASGRPSTAAAKIVVQPAAFPLPPPGDRSEPNSACTFFFLFFCVCAALTCPRGLERSGDFGGCMQLCHLGRFLCCVTASAPPILSRLEITPDAIDASSVDSERTPPLSRRALSGPRSVAPSLHSGRSSSPLVMGSGSGSGSGSQPASSASLQKGRRSQVAPVTEAVLFDDRDGASSTRTLVLEDFADPPAAQQSVRPPQARAAASSSPTKSVAPSSAPASAHAATSAENGTRVAPQTPAMEQSPPPQQQQQQVQHQRQQHEPAARSSTPRSQSSAQVGPPAASIPAIELPVETDAADDDSSGEGKALYL